VFVRGDSHLHFDRSRRLRVTKLLAYRRLIPRFDACLATGVWSREYFQHYKARPERIFFVPHVIDSGWLQSETQRMAARRSELRQAWNVGDENVVFLFVGKFTETKRPLDFVRAVSEAAKAEKTVTGLMVGDGSLRPFCERFVQSHRAPISFTGFLNQSQIARAYASGDVLVLPSVGETWGMVVNEAMACGLPALVSDRVGCGPDLVTSGHTGLIFPHGNVSALSASMVRMARDRVQLNLMGCEAQKRIQRYSLPAAVDGVLQALEFTVSSREAACVQ
jgi:glycosyltransferase involved in cell wall biosynthesis